MRSEKGMSPVKFLIFLAVMMLFLGVTTYVVMQENGIYDREIKPLLQNQAENTNQTATK